MPCCDAYCRSFRVFNVVGSCLNGKVNRSIIMARDEGTAARKQHLSAPREVNNHRREGLRSQLRTTSLREEVLILCQDS